MAIDFSCSSCQKNYRVKDKLAGKTAECTACGAKMRIPQLVAAASESDINLSDLIEDELPTEASATLTPAVTTTCKQCGAPLGLNAVICVACGYDLRVGEVLETESEKEIEKSEARGTSDFLKRGGVFSFLGAMIGAAIWLGLAIAAGIGIQVGYPALLIGLLAGAGMNRGYGPFGKSEVSPTFIAGCIASLMALVGIFAAKGLIFDQLRSTFAVEGKKGVSMEEVTGGFSLESMLDMFGPLELVFIAIAMGAAYALARGDSAMEIKDTA